MSRRRSPSIQDTDADAERLLIELAREMPAWKKCEQVASMTNTCRHLALIGLRQRYPQAGEEELHRRLAVIVLPRDLVVQVYGWDPEVEGY